jgi:hypothetical protein
MRPKTMMLATVLVVMYEVGWFLVVLKAGETLSMRTVIILFLEKRLIPKKGSCLWRLRGCGKVCTTAC